MNNALFTQAKVLYQHKDYQGALAVYTECLQDTSHALAPGEMGLLYHQIGNCLVKLKNPAEAIQAYTQATADPAYKGSGTVRCNLGMAYATLHDLENAVQCFEQAINDPNYETPYKAYMGMGNALMKLGKSAEAGVAFREAALDEANPDPTKALLNLGVCFMALNRPADAVACYESALQFDMDSQTRNKLYASMGQAYVACGQMQKAVDAFDEAIADRTYFLSDSASVDYQRAIGAISTGTTEMTQVLPPVDMSGFDVAADGTSMYGDHQVEEGSDETDSSQYESAYEEDSYPGYIGAYDGDGERFFNASDEELEQWSKGLAKQDRKRRNVGLKIFIVIIIIVLVLLAAAIFAYTQGYGWPMAEAVTEELFADPQAASESLFVTDKDAEAISSMLDPVVEDPEATIDGVNRSMTETQVFATATTPEGGDVTYDITLVRDPLVWKISNIELYFPSQS